MLNKVLTLSVWSVLLVLCVCVRAHLSICVRIAVCVFVRAALSWAGFMQIARPEFYTKFLTRLRSNSLVQTRRDTTVTTKTCVRRRCRNFTSLGSGLVFLTRSLSAAVAATTPRQNTPLVLLLAVLRESI